MFDIEGLLTTIFPKFIDDLQHLIFTPLMHTIFPEKARLNEPGYKDIKVVKLFKKLIKYIMIALFTMLFVYLLKVLFNI